MKKTYRNLAIFFFILIVAFTSYLTFKINTLPEEILKEMGIIENSELEKVNEVLNPVNIILSIDIVLTVLLLFLLVNSKFSVTQKEEVLVPRIIDRNPFQNNDKENQAIYSANEFLSFIKEGDSQSIDFQKIISYLSQKVNAVLASYYRLNNILGEDKSYTLRAAYAYIPEDENLTFKYGEGLVGQAAKDGIIFTTEEIDHEEIQAMSGLGKSKPSQIAFVPVKTQGEVFGVLEIARFENFKEEELIFLRKCCNHIAEMEFSFSKKENNNLD